VIPSSDDIHRRARFDSPEKGYVSLPQSDFWVLFDIARAVEANEDDAHLQTIIANWWRQDDRDVGA
jgi:hypothetical protein